MTFMLEELSTLLGSGARTELVQPKRPSRPSFALFCFSRTRWQTQAHSRGQSPGFCSQSTVRLLDNFISFLPAPSLSHPSSCLPPSDACLQTPWTLGTSPLPSARVRRSCLVSGPRTSNMSRWCAASAPLALAMAWLMLSSTLCDLQSIKAHLLHLSRKRTESAALVDEILKEQIDSIDALGYLRVTLTALDRGQHR